MTTLARTWTADSFWEFVNRPENADRTFELHDGELVEMGTSGGEAASIALQIGAFIVVWAAQTKLGFVTGTDGTFAFEDGTLLVPDVAFIPKTRLAKLPKAFIHAVPALAVEVVSPNQTVHEMQNKALRYLGFGVDVVWLVYPSERTVAVCIAAPDNGIVIRTFGVEQTLDGGEIMPRLSIAVADIFAVLDTLE